MKKLLILTILITLCSQGNAQILSGGPKIQGPWLWVIAPTDLNDIQLGGAAAALSGIDFLSRLSHKAVTEQKIAAEGAVISESVGNKVWSLGSLSPEGYDNINEMLISIGLAHGDINTDDPMQCFSIEEYYRYGENYKPFLNLPALANPWTGKPMDTQVELDFDTEEDGR